MTSDDVIKTYLPNFNLYKHLLSVMHICEKNTLLIIKKHDITVLRNQA